MNLRQKAMQGGVILLARQASGFLGSAVLLVFVVRVIGARYYGIYAACSGIVVFLVAAGSLGMDVYLLREGIPPTDDDLHCASTLLLLIGLVLGTLIFFGAGVISHIVGIPQTVPVTKALAVCIPLYLLERPANAKLCRELKFKRVALNDLLSQSAQCAVAIPLALKGGGVWAPTAGLLSMYLTGFIANSIGAQFLPRFRWNWHSVRAMLRYGFSFSTADWAKQARGLVNPVVVGHFGGAVLVGYVAAAIRIAQGLSFASAAILRVAAPTLSHVRSNMAVFRNGVREAMKFQAIAVGVPLGLFALIAPFAIRLVMTQKWSPVASLFPFVAIGYFALAVFQIEATSLHILGANFRATVFYTVQVVLLAGVAAVSIRALGLIGYGVAEIAALPSYFVIHFFFRRLTTGSNRLQTVAEVKTGVLNGS